MRSLPGLPVSDRGASAAHLLQSPTAGSIDVLADTEVAQLIRNGQGKPVGVEAIERSTGRRTVHRARRYVLSAGAIGSPLVLARSALEHPHLGRNYMMHLSPIVVGIFTRLLGTENAFIKQVGFSDYYFGSNQFAHARARQAAGLGAHARQGGVALAAAVRTDYLRARCRWLNRRDPPNPANRVFWGANGKPSLKHRFSEYDHARGKELAQLTTAVLKRAGAAFCLTSGFASEEHVAHQCGTVRFGNDPAHAVLDADCRMFAHSNVFVVDGSFMPTSLGVGPA